MRKLNLYIYFFLIGMQAAQAQQRWNVVSPDRSLQVELTYQTGSLSYRVLSGSTVIIKPSALGITSKQEQLSSGLTFVRSNSRKIDERYTLVVGKRTNNRAIANESNFVFRSKSNTPLQIDIRAYNDGVAFRYHFPQVKRSMEIVSEQTEFSIPTDGVVWVQNYDLPSDWTPAYEGVYQDGIAIGTNAKDSGGWAFPALFQLKNHWLLLTESNLDRNFYGSKLDSNAANGVYKIAGPMESEGKGTGKISATASTPFSTPWRLCIIGKNLATIVESNLVYHVADKNKIGDVSWVKPGRSSWSWWGDHASSKDFVRLKNFVDLAQEMGWEYSLVDANWDMMEGGDIKQLVDYAKTKKVDLLLWYNSGGPHNVVTERPRDIMSDPVRRKEEFKKLREWGVKGVKIDFFQSDKQNVIALYHDILMDAAREKIMVNFHGCTLPRGWSRTYPNLVTMEAVRGAENYGWGKEYAQTAPVLNNIYTYTRNVVGPMDYTPVTFSDYECCPHTTTNAHELALTVLFESGWLHFADRAEPYRQLSQQVKDFIRTVPVVWDDTEFLQGSPGKETVLARRKGNKWYIAGASGVNAQTTISLQLPFLDKRYKAQVFSDGRTSKEINSWETSVEKNGSLSITVLPKGGFVVVLSPEQAK